MALISVIIPVFNDTRGLQRCLRALARQTLPAADFEVLVVDNASSVDLSPALSELPRARLVHEPTPGSYAARNAGLQHAAGAILAFTDSDCVPHETWLENAVRHLNKGALDALLGGRINLYAHDAAHPTCAEQYDIALAFPQKFYVETRGYSVTANLFTTRKVMDHAGPFDDTLKSGGDKEWCQRAVGQGFTLLYADDVVVEHPARESVAALVGKRRRQVSGQLDQALKRYPAPLAYGLVLGKALTPPVMRLIRARADDQDGWWRAVRRASVVLGVSTALSAGSALELFNRARGAAARR